MLDTGNRALGVASFQFLASSFESPGGALALLEGKFQRGDTIVADVDSASGKVQFSKDA